jgi:hypothetical protein
MDEQPCDASPAEQAATLWAAAQAAALPQIGEAGRATRDAGEAFNRRLHKVYGAAFEVLGYLIAGCVEVGQRLASAPGHRTDLEDALVRNHQLACLGANEARTLIEAGYGRGAASRVRAIYERRVTALILAEHDATHGVARRWLDYEVIENLSDARAYDRTADDACREPLDDGHLDGLLEHRAALVERHGRAFQGPHG